MGILFGFSFTLCHYLSEFTEIFIRYSMNQTDQRKEGNVLFNDALNTFYLQIYGGRHMVKDH